MNDANEKKTANDGSPVYRDRPPPPDKAEKQRRKEEREAEAVKAIAEHEQREAAKRANMERLRAERLARGGQ